MNEYKNERNNCAYLPPSSSNHNVIVSNVHQSIKWFFLFYLISSTALAEEVVNNGGADGGTVNSDETQSINSVSNEPCYLVDCTTIDSLLPVNDDIPLSNDVENLRFNVRSLMMNRPRLSSQQQQVLMSLMHHLEMIRNRSNDFQWNSNRLDYPVALLMNLIHSSRNERQPPGRNVIDGITPIRKQRGTQLKMANRFGKRDKLRISNRFG